MKPLTVVLAALVAAVALAVPAAADAAPSSSLSLRAKITSFHATQNGVVANGTLTGRLRSGTSVSRDSAPVKFRVVAQRRGRRCDVITLRLAPLTLELLGVQVKTSHISLDVFARRGRVLGNLFCALARAEVRFPRVASALNSRLDGRPLRVFTASQSLRVAAAGTAAQAQQPRSCQVLRLVLGPLHLDLLGLVVNLYGRTRSDPVVVMINGQPNRGLLGQLLCGLAGGGGVTDLAGLQSLLSSLGVNLSTAQLQGLLNQLGIGDLSGGLSQLDLNRILQALGLGSGVPAG